MQCHVALNDAGYTVRIGPHELKLVNSAGPRYYCGDAEAFPADVVVDPIDPARLNIRSGT